MIKTEEWIQADWIELEGKVFSAIELNLNNDWLYVGSKFIVIDYGSSGEFEKTYTVQGFEAENGSVTAIAKTQNEQDI